MYDELIKNLRKVGSGEYCAIASTEDFPVMQFVKDAADAIEELVDAFETALKDVAEERENHYWIPVTERLPEYGEKCLVVRKLHSHNDIRIDVSYCYVQHEGFWSDNGRDWHVSHWMPLPQPPESEGDDGIVV